MMHEVEDPAEYVRMYTLKARGISEGKIVYKPITLYVYTGNPETGQAVDLCPSCLNNCLMNIVMSGVNDERTEDDENTEERT